MIYFGPPVGAPVHRAEAAPPSEYPTAMIVKLTAELKQVYAGHSHTVHAFRSLHLGLAGGRVARHRSATCRAFGHRVAPPPGPTGEDPAARPAGLEVVEQTS